MEEVCDPWIITSILQHDCQKIGLKAEMRLHFFGRAVQFNDRTFHAFCEEEIGELMPKNIARTARIQLDGQHLLFGE